MPDAPVNAPAAPVAAPAPVQRTLNDTIAKVTQQTSIAADPVVATPVVQIVRDTAVPTLPAVPVVPPPTPATPPLAAATDAATDTAVPVEAVVSEPTGEITLDDDGIKLTAERNADGTFKTKLDPSQKLDLEFKDKETGEVRKYTKTLPEILRLAKDGVALNSAMQTLKPEVTYYRDNVPKWQAEHKTLSQEVEDLRALNVELLMAPDEVVIQRREAYGKEMSPEKVRERENADLRTQIETLEHDRLNREMGARSQAFLETRGLNTIIKDAETKLGVHAVTGFISMATQPLLVNGMIPPDKWPVLEQFVKGPFSKWVAAEFTTKDTQAREAALARKATEDAQRKAQTAVNDAGRNMVPVGRASPDAPPELPKPKNTKEAIARMVNRPLPATVAAPS